MVLETHEVMGKKARFSKEKKFGEVAPKWV